MPSRHPSPRPTVPLAVVCAVVLAVAPAAGADGQAPPVAPTPVHEHVNVVSPPLTPTTDTSGTAWLPQFTPMYGLHRPWRNWDVRLDGSVFVQGIVEPGERHRTGGSATRQIGSVNWVMAMARRSVGNGHVGFRGVVSAEPWTVPGCGSLGFLATGEVCDGDTIHDRQQPHDLVSELAVDLDAPLGGDWRWLAYAGLAGAPAFGPASYAHRPSSAANAVAPITHHWLEATHTVFGVLTAGVHNRRVKVEASVFNSREPDEERADVDIGGMDSVSARVAYLPAAGLALQVSAARMRDAVSTLWSRPDPAATRLTASATYHRSTRGEGVWASTLALGLITAHEFVPGGSLDSTTRAALLESTYTSGTHYTVFGRAEIAEMPAHHLHALEYARSILPVGKVQVGYVRLFDARRGIVPGLGSAVWLSLLPLELAPRYSGRVAPGFMVFLALRPRRHIM